MENTTTIKKFPSIFDMAMLLLLFVEHQKNLAKLILLNLKQYKKVWDYPILFLFIFATIKLLT